MLRFHTSSDLKSKRAYGGRKTGDDGIERPFDSSTRHRAERPFDSSTRHRADKLKRTSDTNYELITVKPLGKMTINVGGQVYRIEKAVLKKKRNTLLARIVNGVEDVPCGMRLGINEYFFDRNPDIFQSIIHFYVTDRLHIPYNICSKIVKCELKFWGIRDLQINQCCWNNYHSKIQDSQKALQMMKKFSSSDFDVDFKQSYESSKILDKFLLNLRLTFGVNHTSIQTQWYVTVSCLLSFLCIFLTCFLSHLEFRIGKVLSTQLYQTGGNATIVELIGMTTSPYRLVGIDLILNVFFIFDQILRFIASKKGFRFFTSFLNINDLICNVMSIVFLSVWSLKGTIPFPMEQIAHIVRICRIFRIFHHNRRLKIMFYSLILRTSDLVLLLSISAIVIFILGMCLFFSEVCFGSMQSKITSLPLAYYWSIVTTTSQGYGNYVPTSVLSYLIAAVASFSSIFVLFFPIPLWSHNFCLYYIVMKRKVFDKISPWKSFMRRRKAMRIQ